MADEDQDAKPPSAQGRRLAKSPVAKSRSMARLNQSRGSNAGSLGSTEDREKSNALIDMQKKKAHERRQAGIRAFEHKNYEKALFEFTKCIYLCDTEANDFLRRAEVYIKLCDFQSAISNYHRAHLLSPEDESIKKKLTLVYCIEGDLRLRAGNPYGAISCYDQALQLDNENVTVWMCMAVAHVSLKDYDSALVDLRQYLLLFPQDPDALVFRARLLMRMNKLDEAVRDVNTAISYQPTHHEARKFKKQAYAHGNQFNQNATESLLMGNLPEAVEQLTLSMKANPYEIKTYIRRATALRQMGNFEKAIEDLEFAIGIAGGPQWGEGAVAYGYTDAVQQLMLTYNDMGIQFYEAGEFSLAAESFTRAIDADPNVISFYLNRGDAWRQLGEFEVAMRDYLAAFELDNKDWKTRTRLSFLHNDFGTMFYNDNKISNAVFEFTQAVQYNPKVPMYYINRANCCLLLQRYEMVRDDLLIALALDPANITTRTMVSKLCPGGKIPRQAPQEVVDHIKKTMRVDIRGHWERIIGLDFKSSKGTPGSPISRSAARELYSLRDSVPHFSPVDTMDPNLLYTDDTHIVDAPRVLPSPGMPATVG